MKGVVFVLRTGMPLRVLPECYCPYSTCDNCYNATTAGAGTAPGSLLCRKSKREGDFRSCMSLGSNSALPIARISSNEDCRDTAGGFLRAVTLARTGQATQSTNQYTEASVQTLLRATAQGTQLPKVVGGATFVPVGSVRP